LPTDSAALRAALNGKMGSPREARQSVLFKIGSDFVV